MTTGANLIQEFKSKANTLRWNKALLMAKTSHVTCNNQSESFILAKPSQYATVKFVYDVGAVVI